MVNKHLYFFSLEFEYFDENNNGHYFYIGTFSSLKIAKEAIEQLKIQPGFCDSGGEFIIKRKRVIVVDKDIEKEGCTLFYLWHEYEDDKYDYETRWGPFMTYEEVKRLYEEVITEEPYSLYPENLCIDEIIVNVYYWREGFTSDPSCYQLT